MVPIKKKTEKREAAREAKALTAARLEKSLERELIARLKSRAYGDQPLNVNEDVWQAVLNREKEVEAEKELEELGMESDDETDSEQEGEYEDGDEEGQFVSDFDESDVEDMEEYDGEVRCAVFVYPFLVSIETDIELFCVAQFGSEEEFSEEGDEEDSDEEEEAGDSEADEPTPKGGKRKAGKEPKADAKGKGKAAAPAKKPRRSASNSSQISLLLLWLTNEWVFFLHRGTKSRSRIRTRDGTSVCSTNGCMVEKRLRDFVRRFRFRLYCIRNFTLLHVSHQLQGNSPHVGFVARRDACSDERGELSAMISRISLFFLLLIRTRL